MAVDIRPFAGMPLAPVLALVARLQQDPAHHVVLVGDDPDVLRAEVAEVDDWETRLLVAVDGDRVDGDRVVGAVLPDVDAAMRRAWWLGPWATSATVAGALLDEAVRRFGDDWDEEEFAPDTRNRTVIDLAAARGARPNTSSVVLDRDAERDGIPDHSRRTTAMLPDQADRVAALHDATFAGTHTPGARLVTADRTRLRTTLQDDDVVGYVAIEVQPDGSGYVDYLAVAPDQRGQGLGRALVGDAIAALAAEGVTHVHLTVREDATAARAIYASLGFVEERLVQPWRLGFDLG